MTLPSDPKLSKPRVPVVQAHPADPAGSVARFMANVLADPAHRSSRLNLGELAPAVVARIQRDTGISLAGYHHTLQSDEMRHAWRSHGSDGEARDRRPLTHDDLARVGEHLVSADRVAHDGATHQGLPVLRFEKRLDGRTIVIIEEVRAGRRTLSCKTMYHVA